MRLRIAILVIAMTAGATAQAQYRNNALDFSSGWSFLGTFDGLNQSYGGTINQWGATDQFLIGAGIKSAIGYQSFFEARASLGFGAGVNVGVIAQTVVGLYISSGVRYNFLAERHRPFVAGHLQYTQFFNTQGTSVIGNAALGGAALWVGLRPKVGYEFFFMEENSFQLNASPVLYLNLDAPPKFGADVQALYCVYF